MNQSLIKKVQTALAPKKALVKRPAKGFIKHDYLVPGGPYQEQWDWDGFFIGLSLAAAIPSEAIYLKNWALNYLEHIQKNGFVPGLITPQGIDKRLKHIKPFLAQGADYASRCLNDYAWLKPYWPKLKKAVLYREKKYFNKKKNLAAWHDSMESGADNNVALLNYPNGRVLAADLNSFLYGEYQALTTIAIRLKLKKDSRYFKAKAIKTKSAINKYLFDREDGIFYNLENNGQFIKRVSYSCIVPLWAKIAPYKTGRKMIKKYVLNPKKLWARYGIRTLAKDDPSYNQKNIIKPYSNWQGPIWPIANYICCQALLNYGFKQEAKMVAEKIARLCLQDIKKTGGMHENYNAETGQPLAAPDFISWNLLVEQMISEK